MFWPLDLRSTIRMIREEIGTKMKSRSILRRSALTGFIFTCSVAAMAGVPYFEGFENPSFSAPPIAPGPGWFSYDSQMNRVASGTAGIPSRSGGFHAAITPPGVGYSGVFSRLGGYSSQFSGGFTSSLDVYIDLSDPTVLANTYGWDLSTAVSGQDSNHRRDFIFHTASNPLGQVYVGGSNNSNFTRRNDLGSINHYTITASGWYRFEWVFRDNGAGTLAVDLNLRSASNNLLWTETRNDASDVISNIVGGNRYMWFTFLETNYLAIDNGQLRGNDAGGLPVDLNGSYAAPGSSLTPPWEPDGLASATTFPSANQVTEVAGGVAAVENTFTPFSDTLKRPTVLSGLDMRGKSFSADVDLGDPAKWNNDIEFFQLGLGKSAGYFDGTEESFVFIYKWTDGYHIYYSTNWSEYAATPALEYISGPGETKFHVNVGINAAGTSATLSVTPLDGANAGTTAVLDPYALDGLNDDVTNTSFFAGFTSNYFLPDSARAVVSNFRTNAGANWQYAFSADPYNKSSEQVGFEYGMAALAQPVGGFQAYLQSITLAGSLGFGSGSYTSSPFPAGHFYGPPDSTGQLAGGIANNQALTVTDATLANLLFSGTNGTRAAIAINPNNGGGLDTQFSDSLGTPYLASRQNSNVALFDDVAPVLTGLTATQGLTNILAPNAVESGLLEITIDASDALTGLDRQPSITLDFFPLGSGPEDVSLVAYSIEGNKFQGTYNVPLNAPGGAAAIIISAIDRAGNAVTQTTPITVNTATLTLNIQLQSVFASGGPNVTRGINIHFGGTVGGANVPLNLSRDVVFSPSGFATVTFDASDGLPSTPNITTYAISVKDPLHTLRTTAPLTGVGNQYAGSVVLRGGNLNLDNKIDISDYVVYAVRYGIPVSPDTPFPHAPTFRHADISGDGNVDTADFTFLSVGFGTIEDPLVGNYGRSDRTIRTKITVADACRESASRDAAKLDLNGDGVITVDEIQRYMSRRR